jgi:septum formation protein
VHFELRPTGVEELATGDPDAVARENALRKARAARDPSRSELVLGAIYGKPADEAAARATLLALSGAEHTVVSGLALLEGDREQTAVASTRVRFRELAPATIAWYLSKGEWRERAGAYAIQGAGAALVREIAGDYENVVGLPLAALLDLHPQLLTVCPEGA